MNLGNRTNRRRDGFTLVEMMVVIAIIGVLLAILIPAVMNYISSGPRTVTKSEIEQLSTAIESFKQKYKVDFIPSQIRLWPVYADYTLVENGAAQDDPLDRDSVNYLIRLWPQITSPAPGAALAPWKDPAVGINWHGKVKVVNGVTVNQIYRRKAGAPLVTLEGDQCLVFFLGGIPLPGTANSPPGIQGWSHNPRDPAAIITEPTGRVPPLFEFASERLWLRAGDAGASAHGFYSFADTWGKSTGNTKSPYIYFSNYGKRNGYNTNANNGALQRYATGDCQSLGVWPYYQSTSAATIAAVNPSGYQIISAGQDGQFGPGGLWAPPASPATGVGADDQANFSGSVLGAN
jgi:prepilin-type N-terminal cleavage/methylation domain-containing protein